MFQVECPKCEHRFDPSDHVLEHPFEIRARKRISEFLDWDEWAESPKGHERNGVVLVDVDVSYDFEFGSNPIFMVFKIEDEHYMVSGTADSYGSQDWVDRVKYVELREKRGNQWVRS